MPYSSSVVESLFRVINRMHFNCAKREFEKRGFNNASHPHLLFVLRHEIGNRVVSQKELSYTLGINPSTFAVLIKRMEEAELIQKMQNEDDLRCNIITLTEKGKKLVDESTAIFNIVDKKMYQGFTEKEKAQLKQFYSRMIANLRNETIQTEFRT